jgi:hypothetical protein
MEFVVASYHLADNADITIVNTKPGMNQDVWQYAVTLLA